MLLVNSLVLELMLKVEPALNLGKPSLCRLASRPG